MLTCGSKLNKHYIDFTKCLIKALDLIICISSHVFNIYILYYDLKILHSDQISACKTCVFLRGLCVWGAIFNVYLALNQSLQQIAELFGLWTLSVYFR